MGELDGRGADAAADRVDQHRLADPEPAALEEHVPGGAEGDLERGGRVVGEPVRDAQQVPGAADELLGVAAGGREADEARVRAERLAARAAEAAVAARPHQERHHAVAFSPLFHALANGRDPADDLEPEDERRLDREARGALAHVDVEVVECAGEDVEQDLARARARRRHVLELQHVRPAELVKDDGLQPGAVYV